MTKTIDNGRTRTLNTDKTGIDGSGNKVWFVWVDNADGTHHHMERFANLSEAVAWFKWA